MNLPTLFKKTNTGAIQFWTISSSGYDGHGIVTTSYGQLDTDSPQITDDLISEGKNIGKKNETTPEQQADAEALAKWQKQKKKGYVESIESARAGEVGKEIKGGISPMLAHKYSEQGHKIKFPCYAQPKYDGIRCIAILKDGKCTLWSRTRKQITSMPHIVAEIEAMKIFDDITFDGELYSHEFKNDFEKIVSAVRKENPEEGYLNVQYHIYDWADERFPFIHRWKWLASWEDLHPNVPQHLFLADTQILEKAEDVATAFEHYKRLGFEGAMLRNADSKYVNKRSYDLQKVKMFDDSEFDIVGIEEGRGKLQGHAMLVCKDANGNTFPVKMEGKTEYLKQLFENHTLWLGKRLTVQYQGLTGKNKVPRFPVGLRIREPE